MSILSLQVMTILHFHFEVFLPRELLWSQNKLDKFACVVDLTPAVVALAALKCVEFSVKDYKS